MKRIRLSVFLGILAVAVMVAYSSAAEKQLIGARYPAISPDGKHIAFSYMGGFITGWESHTLDRPCGL